MKKIFLFSFIFLTLPILAHAAEKAELFYNQACADCKIYVEEELKPKLNELGFELETKDYLNGPQFRKDLYLKNQELRVPTELQDNLTVFFPNGLIVEGHLPVKLIEEALFIQNKIKYEKLILYQPEMHKEIKSYKILKNDGIIEEAAISKPLSEILQKKSLLNLQPSSKKNILYLTILGGLANSIHPCSIAVLLLLLGFLYSIKQSSRQILLLGFTFILGLFLVYLGIGFGIFKAIKISNDPFFAAKIAAIGLAILGIINILNVFWPNLPLRLRLPSFTNRIYNLILSRATFPLTLLLGAAVGLCAFPCTGGIYTAIITTLAAGQIAFAGYLILYNLIFILPLIIITALSANKNIFERILNFQSKNSRRGRLLIGIFMILISLFIWLWLGSLKITF